MSGFFQQALWLAIFVAGMTFSTNGQSVELKLSDNGKEAYRTLVAVDTFAIGGVGFAGTTSKGEAALRQLLKESNAETALVQLIDDAGLAGGLYALVGLRSVKSEKYDTAAESLPDKPDNSDDDDIPAGSVMIFSGCIGFVQEKTDVVKDISSGKYDLRSK